MSRIGIIELASAIFHPNVCPVCVVDWRQGSCTHQGFYVDQCSNEFQKELYQQARWAPSQRGTIVPVATYWNHWLNRRIDPEATRRQDQSVERLITQVQVHREAALPVYEKVLQRILKQLRAFRYGSP